VGVRRGALGALVAVASLLGVVGPAAAAVPAARAVPCESAVGADASAVAMAAQCGHRVEVLDARTEWNTLYAQPDGTHQLVASAAAVRTRASGAWTDIDSSLRSTGAGVVVASAVTPMTFSAGRAGQPLAQITRDGHELTFDVPFALPTPQVAGSQVTYPAVLPGVDLIVTVNADTTGFSEVLRVASPQAAADPRLRTLQFPVATSADLSVAGAQGGFEATDRAGERVFWSPAPQMWDSSAAPAAFSGVQRPGVVSLLSTAVASAASDQALGDRTVAPVGGEKVAAMAESVGGGSVSIAPDAGMLADPGTVWPVYIDPAVSGSRNYWMSARSTGHTTWMFPNDDGVGLCKTNTYMTCSPSSFASRLRWRFSGLEQIGALDPGDITGATFSVFGTHSYNCTARPITLFLTPDFDSSSGWSTTFGWSGLDTQTVAHKASCGNQRWIGFNAVAAAQAVAGANAGVLALGLGTDESSNVYWKRYRYDATISITFNRAPSSPSVLSIASPVVSCGGVLNSATPILAATASDPDGDNVYTQWSIRTAAGAAVWSAASGWQASGSSFRVQVPSGVIVDGTSYTFGVQAVDTSGRAGPWSPGCAFTANTVAPSVVPTVTAVSGQPAVYAESTRAGGVGVAGAFAFGANGVSDVTGFRYGFDDSAMTARVALGTQVTYTPTTAGPHVLYVASVDSGGLVGPRKDYAFSVDVPGTAAMWLFDEPATSTTALDVVAGGPSLSLSSAALRGPGMMAELDPPNAAPGDGALRFASATDQAVSAAPVVATDRSYSVGAFVKLDDLAGVQTAVSQNGVNAPGFELGYRSGVGSGCPSAAGCWAFTAYGADSASPTATVVASSRTPAAGEWVYLMGTYDAQGHVAGLSVCDPGGEPDAAVTAPFTASWYATSGLAVGRGKAAGVAANGLHGAVDDVIVLTGVADQDAVRRYCAGATTP
jgi:hypothetical protein